MRFTSTCGLRLSNQAVLVKNPPQTKQARLQLAKSAHGTFTGALVDECPMDCGQEFDVEKSRIQRVTLNLSHLAVIDDKTSLKETDEMPRIQTGSLFVDISR